MTTETTTTPAAETTQSQEASSEAAATATAAEGSAAQSSSGEFGGSLLDNQDEATTEAGADKEGEKPAEEKPAGAPEKYEFTPPDGDSFDPKVLGEFEAVARELDMPQESAQKILDKIAPALKAKQQEGLKTAVQTWTEASKADAEIGGDKLSSSVSAANKALDKFGTPELRSLLNGSGLANHPEVLRLLTRAGKAISDDAVLTSGNSGSSSRPMSAADLYPNSKLN